MAWYDNSDDFTGDDGDPPDTGKWAVSKTTNATVEIQSNKLQEDMDAGASEWGHATSTWVIPSDEDFDIRVELTVPHLQDPYWWANFEVVKTSNSYRYVICRRYTKTGHYLSIGTYTPSASWINSISRYPVMSEKLRITRVGEYLTMYYWTGSAWSQRYQWSGFDDVELKVRLYGEQWDVASQFTIDWDNFEIVGDYAVNTNFFLMF